MDVVLALARVGGDRKLLAEMADLFLVEYPKLLRAVEVALDAEGATEAGDAAHQIKGLLAQFAAEQERLVAASLEHACRGGHLERARIELGHLQESMNRLRPQLVNLTGVSLL